jgi:hypothetical protein
MPGATVKDGVALLLVSHVSPAAFRPSNSQCQAVNYI